MSRQNNVKFLDPTEELPVDIREKIERFADAEMDKIPEEHMLSDDELKVDNQNYTVMFFLTPLSRIKMQKHNDLGPKFVDYFTRHGIDEEGQKELSDLFDTFLQMGVKVSGCFETEKEARQRCDMLMKVDDTLDGYPVPMYKWLAMPPDPKELEKQGVEYIYQNDKLNKLIMAEHRKQKIVSAAEHDQRKSILMSNPDMSSEQKEKQEGLADQKDLEKMLKTIRGNKSTPNEDGDEKVVKPISNKRKVYKRSN